MKNPIPSYSMHPSFSFRISLATLFLLLSSFSLCGKTLTKIWESEAVLDKPESALYDKTNGVIYVSNISGQYFDLDGTGFISTLDIDGKVICRQWFTGGLNNPQGLALHDGILYVADLTRIVAIDVASKQLTSEIPIEGSEFINDLTVDSNGDLYASECRLNRIYRIRAGIAVNWLEAPELNGPNGVLNKGEALLFANFGNAKLYSVDKNTQALILLAEGIRNGDGITSDGEGGIFVSGAWQGEVFHINAEGHMERILDLGPEQKIAADIHYISEKHLLIIPTLQQTVLAYRWE